MFNPSIKDEDFIRKNYGRLTKAQICRKYKVSTKDLEKFLTRKGIFSKEIVEIKTRDFTGYQRVSVPGVGNPVILIKPGRCPEEAKAKYLLKMERKAKDES